VRLLLVLRSSTSFDHIRQELSQEHDITVVAHDSAHGSAADSVTVDNIFATLGHAAPDLVLIERDLPRSDAIALAGDIALARASPVIVLAGFYRAGDIAPAAKAGVRGYLTADQDARTWNAAIRAVASGAAWLCPAATGELLDEFGNRGARHRAAREHPPLTERERSVIRLIADGRSNIEVAAELGVSESTIKSHVSRMLAKLEVRRRTQLAVLARDLGIG
jgi:DNA-binding NarL/FixJ family response regulator